MSRLRLSVVLLVCGAGFAACSGSSTAPDSGVDAATDAAVDPGVPDTGPDAPVACTVGDGPAALPAALAQFVLEGAPPPPQDAGPDASDAGDAGDADADADADAGEGGLVALAPVGDLPEPTGGDETGLWAYEKLTVYLPAILGGFVDVSRSGGFGRGWADLTGSSYRQLVDFTFLLNVQGQSIPAPLKITTKGTYTKAGADLALVPECSDGAPAQATTYSFSRLSPTKLQLRSSMALQGVTATVVVDLVKR